MIENPKNLTLSEILDIEKIKVVSNPIDKAHGLPNECYTSPEYLTVTYTHLRAHETDS